MQKLHFIEHKKLFRFDTYNNMFRHEMILTKLRSLSFECKRMFVNVKGI